MAEDTHVYNHYDQAPMLIHVEVTKNTKGYNWTASVSNATSEVDALSMLDKLNENLKAQYGEVATE